jgi:hypothetical protein
MQNDKTTSKYVGYVENILLETKTTESHFQKLTQNKLVDELSPNVEPKVNVVQLS